MAEGGAGLAPSYERQNTEELADLPLKIPVSAIYEHFQCIICMSRIESACVTPCGHRFCQKCIEECINRRHECPCCKSHLSVDELVADHGFDALIRVVREERAKAEKEFFQHVVQAATASALDGESGSKVRTPLEAVLHKHLKQSMALHETYHQQLIRDYHRGLEKVGREKHLLAEQALREFPHDPDHPGRLARLAEIESRWEAKKQQLAEELERVEKLLAAAYDRYLAKLLPPPSTIPVTVKLTVPEKDFTAREILLAPEESMGNIVKKLRSIMEREGMEIAEFPSCDEFAVSIISPFAPLDEAPAPTEEATAGGGGGGGGEGEGKGGGQRITLVDQVLQPDSRPVLEYEIKPGTELRFKGPILLKSDVPKVCFAVNFVKGQAQAMDYFTCKTCGFNWVCQPCSEVCHSGHELVPYVVGHKPTWACCYCPRKKMCGLQS